MLSESARFVYDRLLGEIVHLQGRVRALEEEAAKRDEAIADLTARVSALEGARTRTGLEIAARLGIDLKAETVLALDGYAYTPGELVEAAREIQESGRRPEDSPLLVADLARLRRRWPRLPGYAPGEYPGGRLPALDPDSTGCSPPATRTIAPTST